MYPTLRGSEKVVLKDILASSPLMYFFGKFMTNVEDNNIIVFIIYFYFSLVGFIFPVLGACFMRYFLLRYPIYKTKRAISILFILIILIDILFSCFVYFISTRPYQFAALFLTSPSFEHWAPAWWCISIVRWVSLYRVYTIILSD